MVADCFHAEAGRPSGPGDMEGTRLMWWEKREGVGVAGESKQRSGKRAARKAGVEEWSSGVSRKAGAHVL